jgi:acetyltransferase
MFQENDIGLNKMAATGTEAAIESLDIFEYLVEDDTTNVISGYIEGFKNGRKLISLKRDESGIDMPIVLLKVGESEKGRQAAKSHTGTIAGRYEIYQGIFKETGVISVNDIILFFAVNETLSMIDELPSDQIGVVTSSGGAGVLIADTAEREGLQLPDLDGRTVEKVEQYLPAAGSTLNPIDFATQPDMKERMEILDHLLNDNNVETVIFQITNITGKRAKQFAERTVETAKNYQKPLFIIWTGGVEKQSAIDMLESADIPVFESPALCVRTIGAIQAFSESKPRLEEAKGLPATLDELKKAGEGYNDNISELTEFEGKKLLKEYGIPVVEDVIIDTVDEAVNVSNELGGKVVAKLISPDLPHRNEVGGVRTDLSSEVDVRNATDDLFSLIDELDIGGGRVTLQKQVEGDMELALGIVNSPDFGPVLMFGRGGVNIEAINDITFRSIPVVSSQAESMFNDIDTIDTDNIEPKHLDEIVNTITNFSDLYMQNQWISEADINPIIINDDGPVAVDALFQGYE